MTNILERQINGVEGLRYLTSSSSNDGTSTITVTFDSSRDKDIAAVDVQNRVSVAQPQLPDSEDYYNFLQIKLIKQQEKKV